MSVRLGSQLLKEVAWRRCRRSKHYLKTLFHKRSIFVRQSNLCRFVVYQRCYASPEFAAFLSNPDNSLKQPGARLLKNGRTCTVWLALVGKHKLVVKRYNIKNFWHQLSRAFRRSRAAVSWINAHRLTLYDIATAPPVALIEERFGPLRKRAYFVSEQVDGEDCTHFFNAARSGTTEEYQAAQAVTQLFKRLASFNISHGDLKGTNIIFAEQGPVIIDLDSLREHRSRVLFLQRYNSDIDRFLQNWRTRPALRKLFQSALAECSNK